MKLYGCWLSLYHEINDVCPELLNILRNDLEEVSNKNMFGMSAYEKHGYPQDGYTGLNSAWQLSPSPIWGPDIQKFITSELNDDGAQYVRFHEFLEKDDR